MLIFLTNESILDGVLKNAMYASNTRPLKVKQGNIILIYESRKFASPNEKPIKYVMDFVSCKEDINDETVKIWGKKSKYLIKGTNLRKVEPFDIKDIQATHTRYGIIPIYGYINKEDEKFVLEWLDESKKGIVDKNIDSNPKNKGNQRNEFWNKQSPGKKVGLLVGGAFILLILIFGFVGATMVPPTDITTNTNNNTSETNTATNLTTTTPNVTNIDNSSSDSKSNSKSSKNVYDTYDYWYGFGKGDGAAGLKPDNEIPSEWESAYMSGWYEGNAQYEQIDSAFNGY